MKRRRSAKKPEHVRSHAIRRALERYGLALTVSDFERMHGMIRRDETLVKERQSATRTFVLLQYEGHILPCIYDKGVSHISTFLPLEAIKP